MLPWGRLVIIYHHNLFLLRLWSLSRRHLIPSKTSASSASALIHAA